MSNQSYAEAPISDKEHFIRCGECSEWIDCRDLDEVCQHWDAETHTQHFPDIQYSGSKKIS